MIQSQSFINASNKFLFNCYTYLSAKHKSMVLHIAHTEIFDWNNKIAQPKLKIHFFAIFTNQKKQFVQQNIHSPIVVLYT